MVNAYTLAFGGFLLLGGRAADFVGRKRLLIAGVVVFTGARRPRGARDVLRVPHRGARAAGPGRGDGLARGAVDRDHLKDGPERTRALSVWAAIAVGAAVGLLLGGILTEYLSWEWALRQCARRRRGGAVVAALHPRVADRHPR